MCDDTNDIFFSWPVIMTNDINFNAKSKTSPSIMEPIDETPSLTLKVSQHRLCVMRVTRTKNVCEWIFVATLAQRSTILICTSHLLLMLCCCGRLLPSAARIFAPNVLGAKVKFKF